LNPNNKDFDLLGAIEKKFIPNNGQNISVRVGELPDGTKVTVRSGSSGGIQNTEGWPTFEFQFSIHDFLKIRYL
jgi:hypothetical protein